MLAKSGAILREVGTTNRTHLRDYERAIAPEYLDGLNNLYETWIDNFTLCPVLAVPADDLDFVSHPGHLRLIVEKVNEKLTGKEEVVFELEEMARAAED